VVKHERHRGFAHYRNNGSTIAGLLKSLESQTYRDFTVLILYKPSEGDRTLEVVEEFQRRIDLQVKFQERGHFEEALNAIYSPLVLTYSLLRTMTPYPLGLGLKIT